MQITDLARALNDRSTTGYRRTAAAHLHALTLITTYLSELPALLAQDNDPRIAALAARYTEQISRQLLRNQLHAAHRAEATAAHALPSLVLDALADPDLDLAVFENVSALDEAEAVDGRDGPGTQGVAADASDVLDNQHAQEGPDGCPGTSILTGPCTLTPGRPTYRDTTSFLSSWLHLDYFTAQARIQDAHRLIALPTTTTEVPGVPLFGRLAEQFASGVDPHAVLTAARRLEKITHSDPTTGAGVLDSPFAATTGSTTDVDSAADDPAALEEHTAWLLEEPDPRTRDDQLKKFFTHTTAVRTVSDPHASTGLFRRGTKNGVTTYVFKADGEDSEYLESALGQIDHQRTDAHAAAVQGAKSSSAHAYQTTGGGSGEHPDFLTDEEAETARDDDLGLPEPTVAQSRLAGLLNLLRAQSTPNGLGPIPATVPESGPAAEVDVEHDSDCDIYTDSDGSAGGTGSAEGTIATGGGTQKPQGLFRPTVIVHIPFSEMLRLADRHGLDLAQAETAGAGAVPRVGGITAHGLAIDPGTLRRMLCEANIIPMVLGGASEVLDVGRSQRYFPPAMKRAILARDRGCIVPGCTVPAELCEVDHVDPWENGGPTSMANAATLSKGHHMDKHAGLFEIVVKDGVPWVRLPKHIDPEQRLRRNTIHLKPR